MYKTFINKIINRIRSIDIIYWTILILIIGFLIHPGLGLILMFFSIFVIFFKVDSEPTLPVIILLGLYIAVAIALPGKLIKTTKVDLQNINIKDIVVGDGFIIKYHDGSKIKIKKFRELPECKNYVLYFKVKTYKFLTTTEDFKSGPYLSCKRDIKDIKN